MKSAPLRNRNRRLVGILWFLNSTVKDYPKFEAQTWNEIEAVKREFWRDLQLLNKLRTEGEGVGNIVKKQQARPSLFEATQEGRYVGSLSIDEKLEGSREVEILSQKICIPAPKHENPSLAAFKALLYKAVSNAYFSTARDSLKKIRKCRQCARFFVATARKKKYCSRGCGYTADKKDAKFRVQKSRDLKRAQA